MLSRNKFSTVTPKDCHLRSLDGVLTLRRRELIQGFPGCFIARQDPQHRLEVGTGVLAPHG
jgi:hypothetical protein